MSGIVETNSLSKSRVNLTVTSSVNSTQFTSKLWVLKSITNLQPDRRVNIASLNIPSNVELVDPCFYKPQKIDLLLIVAEPFFDLMCVDQIKLGPSLPVLQKISLGWIVTGRYSQSKDSFNSKVFHINTSIEDESNVDSNIRKFLIIRMYICVYIIYNTLTKLNLQNANSGI